jgi:hypothetical protein
VLRYRHAKVMILVTAVAALAGGVAVAKSSDEPTAAPGGVQAQAPNPAANPHASTKPTAVATPGTPAPAASNAPSTPNGQGPDATGPAKFGLCTAYAAGQGITNGHKADSVAFQALAAAAGGADNIAGFCAGATRGGGGAPAGGGDTPAAGGDAPAVSSPPPQVANEQGGEHANAPDNQQNQGLSHRP